MAVKISLMQDAKNPRTRKVLRYLARHFKKQIVVVLAGEREVFRGPGSQITEWVDRQ